MSDRFVTEFAASADPQLDGHPHDLLARLYREIGISAVAAALEAISKPAAPAEQMYDRRIPAIPQRDDLAA
jgi:hypothetical protein